MTTAPFTRPARLSRASDTNLSGLLGFSALIVVQIVGGVDAYPTIPPGLVISLAVSALVVFGVRWRWTTLVALAWPIMLTVGAILASGTLEALSGDQGVFVQVTAIVQRVALVVALIGGAVAVGQRYRPGRRD